MGSGNYESQILEAIQILVDNAVSKAEYDKTIQGTISRCVDKTIGKYIVRYQDSSFYAYSSNTDTTYSAGTNVYVLVPGNDMSKDKSIIGTVDHLGPDYVSIIEGENGYEVTGVNTLGADASFGLCSYKTEDIKILYDRDNDVDLVGLDVFGFESYIKKSNSIICGATFKTALNAEQRFRGDYGIVFHLDFIDKATGETVTKSYIVNVDQMTGNPYSYTVASRQYGIFDVDGANFISVKQIYIFAYNFPNTAEDKVEDIFVSKVELSAANALDKEAAATCALTFVTPKGTYFDDNDLDSDTRILEAQIRIKGNAIDNDSQNVEYYWFRENNNITTKSEKYNQYGGTGWECLNNYSIVQSETETNEAVVQWTKGGYQYITKKVDNVARETAYKCVAVYYDGTILSKTIIIYNYSSNYEITIKSDSGVTFNYDVGKPTLTCYVNGQEEVSDAYTYVWSVTNSSNQLSVLEETTLNNEEYNNAVASKNALLEKIAAEQLITAADQENLLLYTQIIDQYEYIMRVEENKIHNLKISSITNFSTYKCSVYKSGIFIGTASIIITNSQQADGNYTLVIENGNQIFKYNENGISPANGSAKNPIAVMPLGFTLYDDKGQKINHNVIKDIEWKVAKDDTLINVSLSHGNGTENADGTLSYYNTPELNFRILDVYKAAYDKNDIQLIIKYNDKVISAKSNLTFVKEGEIGTNGTDFVCKIVPNGIEGTITPQYPTITYNEYTNQYSLNYTPKNADKWVKVQLWHDGELIFEGTETGKSTENISANVQWSILQNNYGKNIKDETNLTINKDTAAITFDAEEYINPANIVKAVINYNDVDYYATLPISIVRVINSDYELQLSETSGFRDVMYTADGQSPAYDNQPFELNVFQIIDGIKNDISHFSTSEFAVDYNWEVRGIVYYSEWQSELNLIENILKTGEMRSQKYFKPVDTYNGLCVTNAIVCNITRNDEQLASIHIPVHFYINRYGNSAMNGWDGNSISLDEEGGVVLAPQVGAGSKNEDNTFTGVFMGSVKEAGAEKEEHGLFGYNAGQRTIVLNSEDGSARFGKTGAGQIIIDPSTGTAQLKSGNYVPAKFDENGDIVERGSGMLIDLTEPKIDFGTGTFSVDKDGHVTALEYATKHDLTQTQQEIEESVILFDVILNTTSLAIPVDTSNKPLVDRVWEVSYQGKFKGKELGSVNISNPNSPVTGITVSIATPGKITFTTDNDIAIENIVNDFIFNFSYSTGGKLYEIDKQISLVLAAQGADGQPGKDGAQGETGSDGKSAYQLWLEAGNTGTEAEYLESLKGKDGEDGQPGKDGQDGDDGKSAYQIWLEAGNTGTEEDYLNSLKGKDGEDGKEGPQGPQGEPGTSAYLHIAYANSADGQTDFSTTDSVNKLYIGQYTDSNSADSTDYTKYSWTLIKGDPGEDGEDGSAGADAKNVIIEASAEYFQVIKTSEEITVTPDTITLSPVLQSLSLEGGYWQYLTMDTVDWENVSTLIEESSTENQDIGITIDSTSHELTISKDCMLFTDTNTIVSFKYVSSDTNFVAMQTISKIDNNAIGEIKVMYAATEDEIAPEENSEVWKEKLEDGIANKYIWQRVDTVYANKEQVAGIPVCITFYAVPVIKVTTVFYESNSAVYDDIKNINRDTWTEERPEWSETKYIWSSTKSTLANGEFEYSDPICDLEAHDLNTIINTKTQAITDGLSKSYCRMDGQNIIILNDPNDLNATEFLYIDKGGISFGKKQVGQTIQEAEFTSVWTLDGTFNAQGINVLNLSANNIENGILRLYDTTSKNNDGKLLIFNRDPIKSEDLSDIEERDKDAITIVSSDGLEIKMSNGKTFRVSVAKGFEIISSDGTKTTCRTSDDGNTLEITKTKIIESIDFGDNLRGLVMEREENGKKHKGLGFTKI